MVGMVLSWFEEQAILCAECCASRPIKCNRRGEKMQPPRRRDRDAEKCAEKTFQFCSLRLPRRLGASVVALFNAPAETLAFATVRLICSTSASTAPTDTLPAKAGEGKRPRQERRSRRQNRRHTRSDRAARTASSSGRRCADRDSA